MNPLETAAFLIVVTNRIVALIITPAWDKAKLDKFWLAYVAWLLGGVLVFLSGVNLFPGYFGDPIIGKVLTAVVAGGGANLLHDLFDPAPVSETITIEPTTTYTQSTQSSNKGPETWGGMVGK